jgi:hypothetical protein
MEGSGTIAFVFLTAPIWLLAVLPWAGDAGGGAGTFSAFT